MAMLPHQLRKAVQEAEARSAAARAAGGGRAPAAAGLPPAATGVGAAAGVLSFSGTSQSAAAAGNEAAITGPEADRLRQLQRDRAQLELRKLQADAGLISKQAAVVAAAGLEWLYEDPERSREARERQREAYLLGKPIEAPRAASSLVSRAEQIAAAGVQAGDQQQQQKGGLFLSNDALLRTSDDTLRKLREDPLLLIKQAELAQQKSKESHPLWKQQQALLQQQQQQQQQQRENSSASGDERATAGRGRKKRKRKKKEEKRKKKERHRLHRGHSTETSPGRRRGSSHRRRKKRGGRYDSSSSSGTAKRGRSSDSSTSRRRRKRRNSNSTNTSFEDSSTGSSSDRSSTNPSCSRATSPQKKVLRRQNGFLIEVHDARGGDHMKRQDDSARRRSRRFKEVKQEQQQHQHWPAQIEPNILERHSPNATCSAAAERGHSPVHSYESSTYVRGAKRERSVDKTHRKSVEALNTKRESVEKSRRSVESSNIMREKRSRKTIGDRHLYEGRVAKKGRSPDICTHSPNKALGTQVHYREGERKTEEEAPPCLYSEGDVRNYHRRRRSVSGHRREINDSSSRGTRDNRREHERANSSGSSITRSERSRRRDVDRSNMTNSEQQRSRSSGRKRSSTSRSAGRVIRGRRDSGDREEREVRRLMAERGHDGDGDDDAEKKARPPQQQQQNSHHSDCSSIVVHSDVARRNSVEGRHESRASAAIARRSSERVGRRVAKAEVVIATEETLRTSEDNLGGNRRSRERQGMSSSGSQINRSSDKENRERSAHGGESRNNSKRTTSVHTRQQSVSSDAVGASVRLQLPGEDPDDQNRRSTLNVAKASVGRREETAMAAAAGSTIEGTPLGVSPAAAGGDNSVQGEKGREWTVAREQLLRVKTEPGMQQISQTSSSRAAQAVSSTQMKQERSSSSSEPQQTQPKKRVYGPTPRPLSGTTGVKQEVGRGGEGAGQTNAADSSACFGVREDLLPPPAIQQRAKQLQEQREARERAAVAARNAAIDQAVREQRERQQRETQAKDAEGGPSNSGGQIEEKIRQLKEQGLRHEEEKARRRELLEMKEKLQEKLEEGWRVKSEGTGLMTAINQQAFLAEGATVEDFIHRRRARRLKAVGEEHELLATRTDQRF